MGRSPDMSRYFPLLHDRPHQVYVLKCKTPGHYYVGITTDLDHRLAQHRAGQGAEFTKLHGFHSLRVAITARNETEAKMLERELTRTLQACVPRAAGAGWSASKPPAKVNPRETDRRRKGHGAHAWLYVLSVLRPARI